MANLLNVMEHVMAALDGSEVEFTPDTCFEGESKKEPEFLEKETQVNRSQPKTTFEVVDFISFYGGEKFEQKFNEFLNIPQHSKVSGVYWAEEDEKSVLILLRRMKEWSREEYGSWEVTSCLFKDISPKHAYLCVRVGKTDLYSFVKWVAPHCW